MQILLIALAAASASPTEALAKSDRAGDLEAAGKYREAERLRRRAVEKTRQDQSEAAAAAAEQLGNNLAMQSRSAEAEPLLRRALELRLQLADSAPSPDARAHAASSLNQFAAVLLDKGELREAEAMASRAMWIYRGIGQLRSPAYAAALTNLGSIVAANGNYIRADPLFREAVRVMNGVGERDRWHGTFANLPKLNPTQRALAFQRVVSVNNLGINLHRIAQGTTLPTLFRQSFFARNVVLGPTTWSPSDKSLAMDSESRGAMLSEADRWLRESLSVREQLRGRRHPDTANAMNSLAANLLAQGKRSDAEKLYREALGIKLAFLPDSDRDTIVGNWVLATVVVDQAEARSLYRAAINGVLVAQGQFREFDQAAGRDLRRYAPIFRGGVHVNWTLADRDADR